MTTGIAIFMAAIGFLGWATTIWFNVSQRRSDERERLDTETKRQIKEATEFANVLQRLEAVEVALRDHRPLDDRINDHETRIRLLEQLTKEMKSLPATVGRILEILEKR